MAGVRNDSAVEIIQSHIQSASVCLVTFDILRWTMKPASLVNQWVDSNGNIWFWFSAISTEQQSVYAGGNMEVFYSNGERSKFMSLVGDACHPSGIDRNEMLPAHGSFNAAVADAPFQLIKFIPTNGLYWSDAISDMMPLDLSPHLSFLV